jgi:hypothetical protein
MNIISRPINILTRPKAELAAAEAEPASTGSLITYAAILGIAIIVGALLNGLMVGGRYFAGSFMVSAIVTGLLAFAITIGLLLLVSVIANALAPNFGGISNSLSAMKMVIYAATPVLLVGLLQFLPIALYILLSLAAFGYAGYLLYLGSIQLMKVPAASAAGFTAVVMVIWIVLSMIVSLVLVGVLLSVFIGSAASGLSSGRYY